MGFRMKSKRNWARQCPFERYWRPSDGGCQLLWFEGHNNISGWLTTLRARRIVGE